MNNEIYAEVAIGDQIMRGMVHRPANFSAAQRFPAVMLWHGFTGTRVEGHRLLVKTARRLAQDGFIAVRFDFLGSGESDGDFVDVTPETEIAEALQVLDWLKSQPGVDRTRLGILGVSLGGLVSSCAASRAQGEAKALCLWAATAHMGARMKERTTPERAEELQKQGWFDHAGFRVSQKFIDVAAQMNPLGEAKNFNGRVLVIHGSGDTVVPVAEAHEYVAAYEHCTPKLHIIEGADHTCNTVPWETDLIEITVAWLGRNL